MIIKRKQKLIPVYCYFAERGVKFMYTEAGFCTESEENRFELEAETPLVDEQMIKGEISQFYSSVPEITRDIYTKMLMADYSCAEEKENYQRQIHEIKSKLPKYSKEILKDYYIYKIKKGEFELWKNNFDDCIFEIEKNMMYIDDKDFEIIYWINDKGEYTFEFFEK